MGIFDFFKAKEKDVSKQKPGVDYSELYYKELISCINDRSEEMRDSEFIKKHLAKFSEANDMTTTQIVKAEKLALEAYKEVDNSIVKCNISLDQEMIDFVKYIKVIQCCCKLSNKAVNEFAKNKWNTLVSITSQKLDEARYQMLIVLLKQVLPQVNTDINIESTESSLKNARKIYRITEEHILPIYDMSLVQINYKKNEILHYGVITNMLKSKTKTTAISYQGLTNNIRIMKGLHYRSGFIKPTRIQTQYWANDANGIFWITNQRVGFLGTKSFVFPISKILSMYYEEEKLVIFKEGRETPYCIYMPLEDVEEPLAILSELVNML